MANLWMSESKLSTSVAEVAIHVFRATAAFALNYYFSHDFVGKGVRNVLGEFLSK